MKRKNNIYKSLIAQKVDNYKMIVEESKELKASIESELNPK